MEEERGRWLITLKEIEKTHRLGPIYLLQKRHGHTSLGVLERRYRLGPRPERERRRGHAPLLELKERCGLGPSWSSRGGVVFARGIGGGRRDLRPVLKRGERGGLGILLEL